MWVIGVTNAVGTFRFRRNLYAGSVRIGRAADNEIQLPGARVSRHHGRIDVTEGRLLYRDLGSRNGSVVDGRPVAGPVPLTIGAVVQVGGYDIVVEPDPALAGPGHFTEQADPEPITAPVGPQEQDPTLPSPVELLATMRSGMHSRMTAEREAAQRRREQMDRRWQQVLANVRQLHEHLRTDPRVTAFVFSEDGNEVSVKLRDRFRAGRHVYLILRRGHPDLPTADADESIWIREIGGEDHRYVDAREAIEALVRQIAMHTSEPPQAN